MTFEELEKEITDLSTLPNLDFFIVGQSTMNQNIYGVHLGTYTGKQILIEGGIHAREYPSTLVVIGMIKYMSTINLDGGVYVIPLSNPDGARLVLDGVEYLPCQSLKDYTLYLNENNANFDLWKANALAVDLNVNFNAMWGKGSQNIFCPAPGNFIGYYPESERETKLLIDFTYKVNPDLTLSYHTKGDVIYYGYDGLSENELNRDAEIAQIISEINGYIPTKTIASVGGYSDWVSEYLRVPAFTIEIAPAIVPTPVPLEYVEPAIESNKNVPPRLLEYLNNNENI